MGFFGSLKQVFGLETPEEKIARVVAANPFQIRAEKSSAQIEGVGSVQTIDISIKGMTNSGSFWGSGVAELREALSNKTSTRDRLALMDGLRPNKAFIEVTMEARDERTDRTHPVFCAIENLQAKHGSSFLFRSPGIDAPNGAVGWDNWVKVISIPIPVLIFPRSGSQKVTCRGSITFIVQNFPTEAFSIVHIEADAPGYLDQSEQRNRSVEIAVALGVLVAGVDGERHVKEAKIVKEYVSQQLSKCQGERQRSELKGKLNSVIEREMRLTGKRAIWNRAAVLAEEVMSFPDSLKFQIMELLFKIASADDLAASHETEFLNDLAHKMGMDLDEYRHLRDKALPIAMYEGVSTGNSVQIEDMLGISPEMSREDKKKILNAAYRKWSPLQTSTNPEQREQAEKMVKVIAELRKKT